MRKCTKFMNKVCLTDKTVMLVSHSQNASEMSNMAALLEVQKLDPSGQLSSDSEGIFQTFVSWL